MDRGSISYMLTNKLSQNHLTFLGMHHILVDGDGTVELCDEYPGNRDLGNIFEGTARLYAYPQPFPGPVSLGAVDDIANLVESGYGELTGNHVMSFAAQGGVYKNPAGVPVYTYEHFNFDDEKAVKKEFFSFDELTSPFDNRLVWFLKHRIFHFTLERNYIRGRQFLKGKWRLLRKGKLPVRDLFSLRS